MTRDIYQYYNHLGSYSPYYFISAEGKILIDSNFPEIVSRFVSPLAIDPVAVIEVLNKRYMLGDRTIIKDIFRTPWMAKTNSKPTSWNFYQIPMHQEKSENEKYIAKILFELTCKEIKTYIGSAKKIGILLSGGMDSRMVAGALDCLIKTRQVNIDGVTAYTWGKPESRDVVYAKEITKRLHWNWKHFVVTASDLWENFIIAGYRGCEYSGLHLHAIPQIQKIINDDVLLVGSYGDSIGRAEYEGKRAEHLAPMIKGSRNFGGLVKNKAFKKAKNLWQIDIDQYHQRYPENKSYQQNELDYQIHYMRRMLNPCFEVLNDTVPTYQVFTSPAIFQFMWSLKPECRNDKVYLHMIDLFQTPLKDIPWARTGLLYGTREGEPDKYTKSHNSYNSYLQYELLDRISSRVLSDRVISLNLFNTEAIKVLLNLVKKHPENNFDYLERLTWLVSLDFFLEKYPKLYVESEEDNYLDYLAAFVFSPLRYILVQLFRRIRY